MGGGNNLPLTMGGGAENPWMEHLLFLVVWWSTLSLEKKGGGTSPSLTMGGEYMDDPFPYVFWTPRWLTLILFWLKLMGVYKPFPPWGGETLENPWKIFPPLGGGVTLPSP